MNFRILPKSVRSWFWLIWGTCILLGVSLAIYNYGVVGSRYRNFINSHSPEDIQKIEFYLLDGDYNVISLIRTIDNYQKIEKISEYLSESIDYSPNHATYTNRSYMVLYLNGGDKFEFILQLMEEPDQTVYMDFVGIKGASTSFYGNAMITDPEFLLFLESLDVIR